jgi:hypothetical protein
MPVRPFLRPVLHSLPSFVIAMLCAIVIADRLLAGCSPGWVVALVLMGGAGLVLLRHPQLLRDARGVLLLLTLVPVMLACFFDQSALTVLLGGAVILVSAWWGRGARYHGALRWLSAMWRIPAVLLAQVAADRRIVRAWRLIHGRRAPGAGLLVWGLPLVLGVGFIALFGAANPVIGQWFADLGEWLSSLLDPERILPTPGRVVLWWSVGCAVWILLRLRPPRLPMSRHVIPSLEIDRTALVLRCLLVVNVVFALQVSLDLAYLVGGLHLPEGMTYATYAHRGAWPLLIAALVSAVLVLAAFRPGGAAQRSLWARRLVLLWLGQNVALTIAAAWRLWLYVDAYGLSAWRLGAAIWMGLVAVGLVLIAVRIAAAYSNRWLIDANAAATLVTLTCCCWLDVGGTVAWHNVCHCREVGGAGVAIDLRYLEGFGIEAAPALAWLSEHSTNAQIARTAWSLAGQRRDEAQQELKDWRTWTWIRAQVAALPNRPYERVERYER